VVAQPLRILVWRLYRDRHGADPGTTCIEEGIAYPDELENTASDDHQLLSDYAATRNASVAPGFPVRLELRPLSWWLDERLFRYGFAHADRCDVVGFNLLFDLGRLATYWGRAQGDFRGGFSLGIWGRYTSDGKWKDKKHRQRLRLRAIDPRRTLFRWGHRYRDDPERRGPGRFVDLRTLAFALTDRSYTLEGACAAFGDPYEKVEVEFDRLTPELIDYAREDVEHTAILYGNCLAELRRHPGVQLEPHRLYSPASVGARYLEAMGLRRPLVKFTGLSEDELGWRRPGWRSVISPEEPRGDLDPRLLGFAMSAFFGGRAEARIVRTPVPVVLVDFTSMYPSVNALLGTWRSLCAERLERVDVTEQVRGLLAHPDLLQRCLTKEQWAELGITFVEVEPDRDVLPIRARYDPDSDEYGIGVNPLSYAGGLWYALADVIAAVILSPTINGSVKHPRVVRAVRLEPVGQQPDLKPIQLRGGREIDPRSEDPFVAMIEERQRARRDTTIDKAERKRLERFLKITANASAYGILARFDRREQPAKVSAYGPDDEPVEPAAPIPNPEDPGPFCFPPVAASITAGARLMLALLERLVHEAGGSYAFCDTDSMAIVASPRRKRIKCQTSAGKTVVALSWQEVRRILARFDKLNPYNPKLVKSPWRIEADSLDQELWCYAISAKRYCLYHPSKTGRLEIVAAIDSTQPDDDATPSTEEQLEDWSEHGLGLYLDPTSRDPDRPRRDKKGRRIWVAQAWQWILERAEGRQAQPPDWSSRFALTRFTVSSPAVEAWFAGYNKTVAAGERVRPGSFGLIAHPYKTNRRDDPRPAAPYETNPDRWPQLSWYDRRTSKPLRVLTVTPDDDAETRSHRMARGDVLIRTLGDILGKYRQRAEHKSLAPDGKQAGEETAGLLGRRPVRSSPEQTELTGKESNKLEERLAGEVLDAAEFETSYGRRGDRWTRLIVPVLRAIGAGAISERTGFSIRSVYDVLNRGVRPHLARRAVYERIAVEHAQAVLTSPSADRCATSRDAILASYLQQQGSLRLCEWCGGPIPAGRRADARFCSDLHKKAAARAHARITSVEPRDGGVAQTKVRRSRE
jgi:hypothetical protein